MKEITIVGMGVGEGALTPDARRAIEDAEVIFGAPSVTERYSGPEQRTYPCYLAGDVMAAVKKDKAEKYVVLVSGDVGFYSAAAGFSEAVTEHEIRFVPGISTVNAFFAKLKMPWQDAAFVSTHGRKMNVVDAVRRNRLTFCVTGSNIGEIGTALCKAGFGHILTYVGESLGKDAEQVYEVTGAELAHKQFPKMTVLLFINEEFDDRIFCGLPDSQFSRLSGIPMTKSETRAIIMSKLRLRPNSVCWDVGAGTGSVTVEMALSAYRGHVYSIERREEAIPLIEQNCGAFHLGNVTAICGRAPEIFEEIPAPDAVFIGGSGGRIDEIISAAFAQNPDVRIVVSAVTIETVPAALSALAEAGLEPEIVQIGISRGKRIGKLHMTEAQNPVTIISAGGKP